MPSVLIHTSSLNNILGYRKNENTYVKKFPVIRFEASRSVKATSRIILAIEPSMDSPYEEEWWWYLRVRYDGILQ